MFVPEVEESAAKRGGGENKKESAGCARMPLETRVTSVVLLVCLFVCLPAWLPETLNDI